MIFTTLVGTSAFASIQNANANNITTRNADSNIVLLTLALEPDARGQADRMLDNARSRMDRYAKESPTIGERRWVGLAKKFHLSTVPPDPVVIPEEAGDGR